MFKLAPGLAEYRAFGVKSIAVFMLLATLPVVLAATQIKGSNTDKAQFLEAFPTNAEKLVGFQWTDEAEFVPALGEKYPVVFAVDELSTVTLEVLSADADVVRVLLLDEILDAGTHTVEWDGLDEQGSLVPDEAYVPVLSVMRSNGERVIDDPRHYSGGEIIGDLGWTLRGETELSYELPAPSRVLIRAGIEQGPMVRELKHWEPVSAGRAVVRWDGRDADGVDNFASRDDVWIVVLAYLLPEFSIITTGNQEMDYRTYRERRDWSTPVPDLTSVELHRNGVRLSQDYFLPRNYLPRVSLEFDEPVEKSRVGLPVVQNSVRLRVDVPQEDRWILDSTFYETGFYVNYEFRSEEEQGFVPMVWDLDTSGLSPGRHLATVQLFGFGGFIASDTVEFLRQPD